MMGHGTVRKKNVCMYGDWVALLYSGELTEHCKPAIMEKIKIIIKKIKKEKDTCTTMFIAALFTIAKTWKQPKCPLTDK